MKVSELKMQDGVDFTWIEGPLEPHIVCGVETDGIAQIDGECVVLFHGEGIRHRVGYTWDSSSGETYVVCENGDETEWRLAGW